ncbi:MAG: cymR 1 [Dehalococcoidia bacterium]|nr:cymR 1 [Dehalococcoidia bacterium]
MKLSSKAEYAVRAMAGLAAWYGNGPVPLSQVSEREGISQDYLEHIMASLRRQGLVESARGVKGGYSLAMPPEQISIRDIMWALDGPFVPIECLEHAGADQGACCYGKLKPECTTRVVWVRLQESVTSAMESITLADLLKGGYTQALPLDKEAVTA